MCVGIFSFEHCAIGTVADNDFGALKIKRQKGFKVFLDRYARDTEKNRTGEIQYFARLRIEQVGIDTARPNEAAVKALIKQFRLKRRRCNHGSDTRIMKIAHDTIRDRFRNWITRRNILRVAGMIAGGEGPIDFDGPVAREPA